MVARMHFMNWITGMAALLCLGNAMAAATNDVDAQSGVCIVSAHGRFTNLIYSVDHDDLLEHDPRSMDDLLKETAEHPDNADVWFALGMRYGNVQDSDPRAAEAMGKCAACALDSFTAWSHYAWSLSALPDWPATEAALREAWKRTGDEAGVERWVSHVWSMAVFAEDRGYSTYWARRMMADVATNHPHVAVWLAHIRQFRYSEATSREALGWLRIALDAGASGRDAEEIVRTASTIWDNYHIPGADALCYAAAARTDAGDYGVMMVSNNLQSIKGYEHVSMEMMARAAACVTSKYSRSYYFLGVARWYAEEPRRDPARVIAIWRLIMGSDTLNAYMANECAELLVAARITNNCAPFFEPAIAASTSIVERAAMLCALAKCDPADAIACAGRVFPGVTSNYETCRMWTEICRQSGDSAGEMAYAEQAIAAAPNVAARTELLHAAVQRLCELGQTNAAENLRARHLATVPLDSIDHTDRAKTLLQSGNTNAAVELLLQALASQTNGNSWDTRRRADILLGIVPGNTAVTERVVKILDDARWCMPVARDRIQLDLKMCDALVSIGKYDAAFAHMLDDGHAFDLERRFYRLFTKNSCTNDFVRYIIAARARGRADAGFLSYAGSLCDQNGLTSLANELHYEAVVAAPDPDATLLHIRTALSRPRDASFYTQAFARIPALCTTVGSDREYELLDLARKLEQGNFTNEYALLMESLIVNPAFSKRKTVIEDYVHTLVDQRDVKSLERLRNTSDEFVVTWMLAQGYLRLDKNFLWLDKNTVARELMDTCVRTCTNAGLIAEYGVALLRNLERVHETNQAMALARDWRQRPDIPAEVVMNIASVMQGMGARGEAAETIAHLAEVSTSGTVSAAALLRLAGTHLDNRDMAPFHQVFAQVLKQPSLPTEPARAFAFCLQRAEHDAEALALVRTLVQQAEQQKGRVDVTLRDEVEILLDMGMKDEAIACARKQFSLSTDLVNATRTLMKALACAGLANEAADTLFTVLTNNCSPDAREVRCGRQPMRFDHPIRMLNLL